jgi:hypothetical protein
MAESYGLVLPDFHILPLHSRPQERSDCDPSSQVRHVDSDRPRIAGIPHYRQRSGLELGLC